jgi:regulator of replication initiation timing
LALLGERVQPAFPETSRLLEVAEAVDDLASAMEDDMKETEMEKDMNPVVETSEIETAEPDISEVAEIEAQPELVSEESDATETVSEDPVEEPIEESEESTDSVPAETTEASEESEEIASLTVNDLRDKIGQAVREKLNQYCWVSYLFPEERAAWVEPERRESELDYLLFTYSVEGDEVIIDDGTPVKLSVSIASINETLAEKDAAIAAMITENTELKAQIEELNKIKAEYDKIQKKKAEDELAQKQEELRAYAMRSGLFTEGELSKGNAKKLIDALNKTAIDQIIADRYMAQLKSVKSDSAVETSEVHEKHDAVDLASNEESPVHVNVVRAYLDN